MRFALLTLIAPVACLALVACKDAKPEPLPRPPPPPHDGVTLIQPGTAPLQVLRYHLTKGAKSTSELVYDVDIRADDSTMRSSGSAAGSASAASPAAPGTAAGSSDAHDDGLTGPTPTLIVRFETVVDDVLADGRARLRITILDARVRDRVGSSVTSEQLRKEAAAATGVVITETLAPDGTVSDPGIVAPVMTEKQRSELESLVHSLSHVAMQLPAEPVGAGATWRDRRPLNDGGIAGVAETTYTLKSLSGSTIAYSGAAKLSGGAQTIEQEGIKLEVTSPHGHAETTGTIDLARYAPEVTSTSSFSVGMAVNGSDSASGSATGASDGPSTIQVNVALQLSAATPSAPAASTTGDAPAAAPAQPAAPIAPAAGVAPAPAAPPAPSAPIAPAGAGAVDPAAAHGAHSAP